MFEMFANYEQEKNENLIDLHEGEAVFEEDQALRGKVKRYVSRMRSHSCLEQ